MRAALAIAVFAIAARARADESCATCHAAQADDRLRAPAQTSDVHSDARETCTQCHGGDPSEPTARAHDLGAGFNARPDIAICGGCHDGSIDAPAVLDDYRHGAHAHTVATCASCHGGHPIAHDARRELLARCADCHAEIDVAWGASVHAGAPGGPDCAGCHDAHDTHGEGGLRACGRCHEGVRAAFDRGPHAAVFARLGFLDCAECHGAHDIAPARGVMLAGIGAACARCHGPGQEAFAEVRAIASRAAAIDRARAALPRSDPRRAQIVGALHALDAEALDRAISFSAELEVPRRRPRSPPTPWEIYAGALGVALLGVLAIALFVRAKRAP